MRFHVVWLFLDQWVTEQAISSTKCHLRVDLRHSVKADLLSMCPLEEDKRILLRSLKRPTTVLVRNRDTNADERDHAGKLGTSAAGPYT